MAHITKIAAVETTTAIWEYDPVLPSNWVLNGSLDIIAAIRTLAIKVYYQFGLVHLTHILPNRYKHPDNGLRSFKSSRASVELLIH